MKKIIILITILFSVGFGHHDFTNLYLITKGAEIVQTVNKNIDQTSAFKISEIAYQESEKYDLDFHFTLGIMTTESRFNVNAKSYCGAIGLMQLMPKTAEYITAWI